MATDEFSTKINNWVRETEQRVLGVFKESTQRLISKMQERIPVATGFARSSIMGSLEQMPAIDPTSRGIRRGQYGTASTGVIYSYDGSQIAVTIARATLDDTIFVGYTASYVEYLEYGHSSQAPSGFVGVSAMEWPAIVSQVSAELKNRTMGDMG